MLKLFSYFSCLVLLNSCYISSIDSGSKNLEGVQFVVENLGDGFVEFKLKKGEQTVSLHPGKKINKAMAVKHIKGEIRRKSSLITPGTATAGFIGVSTLLLSSITQAKSPQWEEFNNRYGRLMTNIFESGQDISGNRHNYTAIALHNELAEMLQKYGPFLGQVDDKSRRAYYHSLHMVQALNEIPEEKWPDITINDLKRIDKKFYSDMEAANRQFVELLAGFEERLSVIKAKKNYGAAVRNSKIPVFNKVNGLRGNTISYHNVGGEYQKIFDGVDKYLKNGEYDKALKYMRLSLIKGMEANGKITAPGANRAIFEGPLMSEIYTRLKQFPDDISKIDDTQIKALTEVREYMINWAEDIEEINLKGLAGAYDEAIEAGKEFKMSKIIDPIRGFVVAQKTPLIFLSLVTVTVSAIATHMRSRVKGRADGAKLVDHFIENPDAKITLTQETIIGMVREVQALPEEVHAPKTEGLNQDTPKEALNEEKTQEESA